MPSSEPHPSSTTWRYVFARDLVDGEERFTVRELYTDGETGALSWSVEPIAPQGETWLEIVDDLTRMTNAFGSQVLDLTLDPPALVKPRRLRELDTSNWTAPRCTEDPQGTLRSTDVVGVNSRNARIYWDRGG